MEARSLDSRVLAVDAATKSENLNRVQDVVPGEGRAFTFTHHFAGTMELAGSIERVEAYLDAHQGWFRRCARPMRAEPLGDRGYILTIGRYGAFGYDVEPQLAVELLPGVEGCYRMDSVPLPGDGDAGYRVDYQAVMQLVPVGAEATHVDWHLDLAVAIEFPGFIRRLPRRVIQRTGDRLMAQIVRQVSRRLTRKVQADFHASLEA